MTAPHPSRSTGARPLEVRAITALMPVRHHHEAFLRQSVASVLGQTCPDWRLIIIVEPGEQAAVAAALESALTDPRVRLLGNEGRGLPGAFNTGMRHATTDFVAILLADDMWSEDAVSVLAREIRGNPDADFFHSSRRFVNERNEPISSVYRSREHVSVADFVHAGPVKHLLCWRRQMGIDVGGMDERFQSVGPDDYDFPWTMAEHGARFRAVKECLYLYRDHRECRRLTTHTPLSTHKRELRGVLRKHGVDAKAVSARVRHAEQTYLRQCLYASRADEKAKTRQGFDAREGWRETYR